MQEAVITLCVCTLQTVLCKKCKELLCVTMSQLGCRWTGTSLHKNMTPVTVDDQLQIIDDQQTTVSVDYRLQMSWFTHR